MGREGLSDKLIFEQRAKEMRKPGIRISGESTLGSENIGCKGLRQGAWGRAEGGDELPELGRSVGIKDGV